MTSAIPTARVWRTRPGVPGKNAAPVISSLKSRPRTGCGSRTRPPSSALAAVPPCSEVSVTVVAWRTPPTGASLISSSVTSRGVVQLSHAPRPRRQGAIQAVSTSSSNARDARRPGADS